MSCSLYSRTLERIRATADYRLSDVRPEPEMNSSWTLPFRTILDHAIAVTVSGIFLKSAFVFRTLSRIFFLDLFLGSSLFLGGFGTPEN